MRYDLTPKVRALIYIFGPSRVNYLARLIASAKRDSLADNEFAVSEIRIHHPRVHCAGARRLSRKSGARNKNVGAKKAARKMDAKWFDYVAGEGKCYGKQVFP